jgi:hypothetical protein
MYEELFLEFLFCAWLWNHRFKCFEGMYRIHCMHLILSFKKFSLKYCDVLIYFRISFLILVFWFNIVEVRKKFTFHYPFCWDLLSKSFSWFNEFLASSFMITNFSSLVHVNCIGDLFKRILMNNGNDSIKNKCLYNVQRTYTFPKLNKNFSKLSISGDRTGGAEKTSS